MIRRLARHGTPVQWAAFVWLVGVSLLVGVTFSRQASEDNRRAVQQDRETFATCQKWQAEARADVVPTTTDLGRVVIRTAAAGYELIGCERFTGPLGEVDPDAYRLAPLPGR